MKMIPATMAIFLLIAAVLAAPSASGSLIFYGAAQGVFQDKDPYDLSASAAFSLQDGKLQVILTNTHATGVKVPIDVLTGVFFSLPEGFSLQPVSALLPEGSSVLNVPSGYANNPDVGAEWAYRDWIPNLVPPGGEPLSTNRGISSSGLGVFGPEHLFPNTTGNLSGPESPDGLQYGIASAGGIHNNANPKVKAEALIKNSVTFLLEAYVFDGNVWTSWTPESLDGFITNVWFQYGTGTDEPGYEGIIYTNGDHAPPNPVPEPATALLVGLSLLGLAARKRWMS